MIYKYHISMMPWIDCQKIKGSFHLRKSVANLETALTSIIYNFKSAH